MKIKQLNPLILAILAITISCSAKTKEQMFAPGAHATNVYLPDLQHKKVALVCNQNSKIGERHLVDSLLVLGIDVVKVFSPEHGFNINYSDGAVIENEESLSGKVEIISLYGKNRKPQDEDLEEIDILVFDLQDVGVRFYTYLSTLHYALEACAENNIPVLILDRPNPNGSYLDGPVLDTSFASFIGMHPVPVVYSLTIGEYAKMINGEGWLGNGVNCSLKIIPCKGYQRDEIYELPGSPSPNLPNTLSIQLYPSLAFFEGTPVSIGRGTDFPFQVMGHPELKNKNFSFTPRSIPGVSISPKFKGEICFGYDFRDKINSEGFNRLQLNLKPIIEVWSELGKKEDFFTNYFRLLAGTDELEKMIISGMSVEEIRETWNAELETYKKIRIKYLIYPDF